MSIWNRIFGSRTDAAPRQSTRMSAELAEQWHQRLNSPVRPDDVDADSSFNAWWACPTCLNVWQAVVSSRTEGAGCPACEAAADGRSDLRVESDRKQIAFRHHFRLAQPGRSLANLKPDIASLWHPTKNDEVTPDMVGPGSGLVAWWECPNGHEWRSIVNNEVARQRGCPTCHPPSRRRISGLRTAAPGQSLADLHPEVAALWHPRKNGDATPDKAMPGSNFAAWWICPNGHEWRRRVRAQVMNNSCPLCQYGNAHGDVDSDQPLADLHPEVAGMWDQKHNRQVTPSTVRPTSTLKVHWRCPACHHAWVRTVADQVRVGRCEQCRYGTARVFHHPKQGNSLADRDHSVAALWDRAGNGGVGADSVSIMSGLSAWWKCPDGHMWERSVKDQCVLGVCPTCDPGRLALVEEAKRAGVTAPPIGQSLADLHPDVAAWWCSELNGALKSTMVNARLSRSVWWECPRGHRWSASVLKQARNGCACQDCYSELAREASVAVQAPSVAQWWDAGLNAVRGMDVESVPASSKRTAWWRCERGHLFDAPVSDMVARPVCPVCTGGGSLDVARPDIAELWDYRRNSGVSVSSVNENSGREVWWICPEGHEVCQSVESMCRAGCSECARVKRVEAVLDGRVCVFENSVEHLRGDVSALWHPNRNGEVLARDVEPDSPLMVWWKCPEGHEWRESVAQCVNRGGCARCAHSAGGRLSEEYPDLAAEWVDDLNAKKAWQVKSNSKLQAVWRCHTCGETFRESVKRRVHGVGCPNCG